MKDIYDLFSRFSGLLDDIKNQEDVELEYEPSPEDDYDIDDQVIIPVKEDWIPEGDDVEESEPRPLVWDEPCECDIVVGDGDDKITVSTKHFADYINSDSYGAAGNPTSDSDFGEPQMGSVDVDSDDFTPTLNESFTGSSQIVDETPVDRAREQITTNMRDKMEDSFSEKYIKKSLTKDGGLVHDFTKPEYKVKMK